MELFMGIRKMFHCLLSSLFAVCGLSCVREAAYGCPSSDFVLRGTVVDEKGNPIEGIYVSNEEIKSENTFGSWKRHAVVSDADGKYLFHLNFSCDYPGNRFYFMAPCMNSPYELIIPNGEFQYKGGNGDDYSGKCVLEKNVTLDMKSYGCGSSE